MGNFMGVDPAPAICSEAKSLCQGLQDPLVRPHGPGRPLRGIGGTEPSPRSGLRAPTASPAAWQLRAAGPPLGQETGAHGPSGVWAVPSWPGLGLEPAPGNLCEVKS
ncbi:hypothetical protein P7K49_036881 [Saguinus oedipus]|uniref:Uncharacterized protein n=1 Tax=Saguinus oedipus TaxID=9490 RepID=A0ABQ9TLM5_SAGOE|nr:hypothetical protein P7K49_036881 [Saguinus oedipus]